MEFLYRGSDADFHRRALELLDAHGIVTRVEQRSDAPPARLTNEPPRTQYIIFVERDGDFAEAKKLLQSIGAYDPVPTALPSRRAMPWLIAATLIAVLIGLYFFDNA